MHNATASTSTISSTNSPDDHKLDSVHATSDVNHPQGSDPRTQYVPRAIPAAILDVCHVLLLSLCLIDYAFRAWPDATAAPILRGLVRIGARYAHHNLTGLSTTRVLGQASFSGVPAVAVDRGCDRGRCDRLGFGGQLTQGPSSVAVCVCVQ